MIKKFEYLRFSLINDAIILDKMEIDLISKLKPKLNKLHIRDSPYSIFELQKTVDEVFK